MVHLTSPGPKPTQFKDTKSGKMMAAERRDVSGWWKKEGQMPQEMILNKTTYGDFCESDYHFSYNLQGDYELGKDLVLLVALSLSSIYRPCSLLVSVFVQSE